MMTTFKLAFRDLARNRRRSFFSSLALGLGLALLLFMASILTGEMRTSMDLGIKLNSGHFQVRAATYNEDKTSLAWEDLVENPDKVAAQIAALPQVQVATPRLYASGLLTSGNETAGVRIMGIDVTSKANEPYVLVSGSALSADDRSGIYIGQRLADRLNVKAGDTTSLLVNTANGDVDTQTFTVRGTFNTRTPALDQALVLMPLAKAQAIVKAENHASAIFVLLQDRDESDAVVAALKGNSAYTFVTWQQANALVLETEKMANAYIVLLYLIVLGVTATVIVNTLIMAVFERTREIGILAAIGMRGARIMGLFFAESFLLAVGGVIIGLILGLPLVAYASQSGIYLGDLTASMQGITFGDTLYGYLTLKDTLTLTILTFIVALLAALYPALLASRMQPVEALHGK